MFRYYTPFALLLILLWGKGHLLWDARLQWELEQLERSQGEERSVEQAQSPLLLEILILEKGKDLSLI